MSATKEAFLRAFAADLINAIGEEKENAAQLQAQIVPQDARIAELEAEVKALQPVPAEGPVPA